MALRRTSWTTKPPMALTCETMEEANRIAIALHGLHKSIMFHIVWSGSQGGYVVYNEAGTKMIADR